MVNEWFMKGTAVQKLAEQLGSVKSALEQLSRERGGSVFTWRRDREIALEATKLHATFPELTEPQHWSIGVKAMGYVVRLANHLPLERLRPIAHDAVNAKISVRDLELIWDDVRLLGAGGPSRIRRGRRPNKGDVEPTEQNGIQVENRVAVALRRTLPRVLKYDSMVRVVRPRRKISPSPDLVIVGAVDGGVRVEIVEIKSLCLPKDVQFTHSMLPKWHAAAGWIVIHGRKASPPSLDQIPAEIGIIWMTRETDLVVVKAAEIDGSVVAPFPWSEILRGLLV